MLWRSDSYKSSLCSYDCWQNIEVRLEDDRERSRPVLLGEQFVQYFLFWTPLDQFVTLRSVQHMNNDGVRQRPLFCSVYLLQCLRVKCISSQPIYSLSRKSNQISILDAFSSFPDIGLSEDVCGD